MPDFMQITWSQASFQSDVTVDEDFILMHFHYSLVRFHFILA